jgi:kinesin family protein 5
MQMLLPFLSSTSYLNGHGITNTSSLSQSNTKYFRPANHADKLQVKLREEGGIRALLGMVRSRHPDVLAQVARGIANFAKCESRGAAQGIYFWPILFQVMIINRLHALLGLTLYRTHAGYKLGRSLLIDDGALPWIVANANNEASPIRRHIELALCHLAQHGTKKKSLLNSVQSNR